MLINKSKTCPSLLLACLIQSFDTKSVTFQYREALQFPDIFSEGNKYFSQSLKFHPEKMPQSPKDTRVWRFGFKISRFRNFSSFQIVLDSVSKKFGIGFGIGKFWYRKKYRIRYWKNLVSKKVSDSVLKIFGIGKSIGFGIGKFFDP